METLGLQSLVGAGLYYAAIFPDVTECGQYSNHTMKNEDFHDRLEMRVDGCVRLRIRRGVMKGLFERLPNVRRKSVVQTWHLDNIPRDKTNQPTPQIFQLCRPKHLFLKRLALASAKHFTLNPKP